MNKLFSLPLVFAALHLAACTADLTPSEESADQVLAAARDSRADLAVKKPDGIPLSEPQAELALFEGRRIVETVSAQEMPFSALGATPHDLTEKDGRRGTDLEAK